MIPLKLDDYEYSYPIESFRLAGYESITLADSRYSRVAKRNRISTVRPVYQSITSSKKFVAMCNPLTGEDWSKDEIAFMSSAIAEAEAKSGVKTPNYDLEKAA